MLLLPTIPRSLPETLYGKASTTHRPGSLESMLTPMMDTPYS